MRRKRFSNIPAKLTVDHWLEDTGQSGVHKQASAIAPSGERIYVDVKMKPVLRSLWHKGYLTFASCQGGKQHGWTVSQHLGARPSGDDHEGNLCFSTERHMLSFFLTLREIIPENLHKDFYILGIVNPCIVFHPRVFKFIQANLEKFPNPDSDEVDELIKAYIASAEYEVPYCVQYPAYNEYREVRNASHPEHIDPPLEAYPEDYPKGYHEKKVRPKEFTMFRMG